MKTIYINESDVINYNYVKGQYFINIPVVYEGGKEGDYISFLYDTGAYITVVSRTTYERYKFNKLPKSKMVQVHG